MARTGLYAGVCIFLDGISVSASVRIRFVLTDPVMHEDVHVIDLANETGSIVDTF